MRCAAGRSGALADPLVQAMVHTTTCFRYRELR
jgi:hypothetical protein